MKQESANVSLHNAFCPKGLMAAGSPTPAARRANPRLERPDVYSLTALNLTDMTTFFVSRHPGAINWAKKHSLAVDRWVAHLEVDEVQPGDTVVGTLPVATIAAVCGRNARFVALEITLTANRRGVELSDEEMDSMQCRLCEFSAVRGREVQVGEDGTL